ncbi:hypothetical protein ACIO3O_00020 [Streptomyces sp. NPDC087440]|uniref:hypothetical protein n=1 Tax=Streptomyces sp. NPDC087440 TaxID=3365790 RepID=UPI00382C0EE2
MSDQSDTTASQIPVVVTYPNNNAPTIPQGHLTVTGTGEPGAAITLAYDFFPGSATIGTAVVDATGAWSCTTTTYFVNSMKSLSDGEHIEVRQKSSGPTAAESWTSFNFSIEYDTSFDEGDPSSNEGRPNHGAWQDLR